MSTYDSWNEDYDNDMSVTRCKNCIKEYYICPCCGKPFALGEKPFDIESNIFAFYLKDDDAKKYKLTHEEAEQREYNTSFWRDEKKVSYEYENRFKDLKYCYENLKPEHIKDNPRAYDVTIPKGGNAEPLFMCSACYHYLKAHEERMFIKGYVYSYVYITDMLNSSRLAQITFINNDNVNEKEVEKYFFKNLKKFEV